MHQDTKTSDDIRRNDKLTKMIESSLSEVVNRFIVDTQNQNEKRNTIENGLTEVVQQLAGNQVSSSLGLIAALRGYAVTQNRLLLSEYYNERGIVQTLVDTPVDDALRGGLDISCKELDSHDLEDFNGFLEEAEVLSSYGQGIKWARLFGGGGVLINCGQNPLQPLNMDKIKKDSPLEFYAVDRLELTYQTNANLLDQYEKNNMEYPYNYYGKQLHRSHVIKMKGREAPSIIRGQYMGWGTSVMEHLVQSLNLFSKNADIVYELLDEAKIDVFKIEGFNSALATPKGSQDVARRIQLAAQLKNFQNALAVDKNDDFTQKQISFSGLGEILDQIRIGMASDCHMPLTKLFGIASAGLINNGDDIENYNNMVTTEIRSKFRRQLRLMLEIAFRKFFGFAPSSLSFQFKTLRELSPKEKSEVDTQQLNRVIAAFQNGLMLSDAAVDQINALHIFRLPLNKGEALSIEDLQKIRGNTPAPTVPGYGAGTSVVTT
jgi:uncharacterized protein